MSEKIKSSDIFEGDIFKIVVDSAELAKTKISELNEELVKVGTSFKKELKSVKTDNVKEINDLIVKVKELTSAVETQTKVNKANEIAIREAKKTSEQALREEEKTKRETLKTQEQINKSNERAVKNQKDLSDAYKQLAQNTRDLKNESKRLGAEMLELEKQGKKNSAEYYKLSKQYKETTKSAIEGDKALKKLDSTVGDNFRNVGNYQKAIGGLKYALTQLGLAFGVFDGIRALIDTQVKLDSLNLALKNISGSTKEYQANFAFLRTIANKYGQDLIGLIDSYKNFIAASESSNLSLNQRRRIYESVIKAGSALALSNDNIKGSLLAISQMFSKGTVSAEELRQQLGERLPGAFGMMAKSMGVSEVELNKLMKDGKVLADEVLPKFAVVLERSMGKNAEERLKTLGGAFNVLKNNIALYFDGLQKSISLNRTFAFIINGVANNIGSLLNTLKNLTIAFATYKGAVLLSELKTKAFSGTLLRTAEDAKTGERSITKLGTALTTMGWTVAIAGAIKLVEYIMQLANGTDRAKLSYERYLNAQRRGDVNANEFIQNQRDLLSIEQDRINVMLDEGKIKDAQHKKMMSQATERTNQNIRNKIKELEAERKPVATEREAMRVASGGKTPKSTYSTLDLIRTKSQLNEAFRFGDKNEIKIYTDLIDKIEKDLNLEKRYNILGAKLTRIDTELPELYKEIKDNTALTKTFKAKGGSVSKDIPQNTKELRDLNIEYNQTNEYLSRQVEILKDIEKIKADDKMQEAIDKTRVVLDKEEKSVNLTGKYNANKVKKAIEVEYKAKKEFEEKRFKAEEEDKKIRDTKTFNDELEAIEKQEQGYYEKLRELNSDYYRRLADYQENLKLTNLSKSAKKQREAESKWLDETGKQVIEKENEIIKKSYVEKEKVYENKIKREADTNLEIEGLQKNHEKNMANIKRDSQIKTDEELYKLELIKAEKRLERIKNTAESVNNIIQKSLEHYVRLAERRMDILDKRMERMSTQADFLRNKAVAGSIQAQESLAVIDKQQIENEKQRINEQRSIQRLQMAMAVFQAYSNNIQNAKVGENPFTKTLTDVTLLNQFVASLPTFIDGTETNIAESLGKAHMQGQDGYIVRVDGSEKVLNPKLSAMTGNMTTYEIAKLAEDFRRGEVMRKGEGAMQLNVGSWGTDMIVSELQDLKNVIKNKPENQVEVAEILNGVMHIVETKKSGNTKVRNISRFS
jgi:tape measure domain-containing protein